MSKYMVTVAAIENAIATTSGISRKTVSRRLRRLEIQPDAVAFIGKHTSYRLFDVERLLPLASAVRLMDHIPQVES